MYRGIAFLIAIVVNITAHVSVNAKVTFNLEFEPGSAWFDSTYGSQARANMQGLMDDLGDHFRTWSTVDIYVTDNVTNPGTYASAGSTWIATVDIEGKDYRASSLWAKINRGLDYSGSSADANIHWNFDLDLYDAGGTRTDEQSWQSLLGNIAGLSRHEIMHPLGMTSSLFHDASGNYQGQQRTASVYDRSLRDLDGAPLLGSFDENTGKHTVASYVLDANWENTPGSSGISFLGIDASGTTLEMPVPNRGTNSEDPYIDFSHVTEVSYANARPPGEWGEVNEADASFLRGIGYDVGEPLVATAIATDSADSNPDLLSAEVEVSASGNVTFDFQLREGTYQPAGGSGATRIGVALDLDQNAATGRPGINGFLDDGLIGYEFLLSIGDFSSNTALLRNSALDVIGSFDVVVTPDGPRVTIPLAELGNDDGLFDFKAYTVELFSVSTSSPIRDVLPNLGSDPTSVYAIAPEIEGDYNNDGTVDAEDYAVWKTQFGSVGAYAADGNQDGTVGLADYTVWRDNLGTSMLVGGATLRVPEPRNILAGISLMVLLGLVRIGRFME